MFRLIEIDDRIRRYVTIKFRLRGNYRYVRKFAAYIAVVKVKIKFSL